MRSTRWYARELERRERAWTEERARLVETICRLAGKGLPPAPSEPTPEPEPRSWTATPEQQPLG